MKSLEHSIHLVALDALVIKEKILFNFQAFKTCHSFSEDNRTKISTNNIYSHNLLLANGYLFVQSIDFENTTKNPPNEKKNLPF